MKPSAALQKAFEKEQDSVLSMLTKLKKPINVLSVIVVILLAVSAICLALIEAFGKNEGTAAAYRAYPWAFWLCGLCLISALILEFYQKKKVKNGLESEEAKHTDLKLQRLASQIYNELGVPQNAFSADVLSFEYRQKDDKIIPEKNLPYVNAEYKAFSDGERLYLANTQGKYSFPLSSVRAIRRVKKSITLFGWNKEEKLNKGEYKQYRISCNADTGEIKIKWYYIIELDYGGEQWGIFIPNYEISVFEKLTGLSAE